MYLALTHNLTVAARRRVLAASLLVAMGVSISFALLGKVVFVFLGITVADFQIASGLILVALGGLLFAGKFYVLRIYLNRVLEKLGLGGV